ncbi:MAG: SidA/IucD/PvdA family monooxygenase [Actinomycetes bacterium]
MTPRPDLVTRVRTQGEGFELSLESGDRIEADVVVAAPGVGYFAQVPPWAASLPDGVGSHTCDTVRFDEMAGARVLLVGGRQSAYEWAALLGEAGAERIDVVHRHDVPTFDHVSWKFVDAYVDATVQTPGWWRDLPPAEQRAIERRFWDVGRLTLEWWLTPRLRGDRLHLWPGTTVTSTATDASGATAVSLSNGSNGSNGEVLTVDRVVFATGYRAQLSRVPYLTDVIGDLDVVDGFAPLDHAFQSNVPGLYLPGFAAVRDFGPFFGFTKACPAAAALIVQDVLTRS